MRKLSRSAHPYMAVLVVALALGSVNVAILNGCASDPSTKSYQTIGAINTAVQAAVRSFGVIYQSKKAEDPALWGKRYDQVDAAYRKYQAVAFVALTAAQTAGETHDILATVRASADDLLNLLTAFGVK